MTKNRKPLIFITNDDGIQAKGINDLINEVKSLGEVVVVAPDGARSGMSAAITSASPLRVNLLREENDLTVYSCNGTPVDCVKLGINEILDKTPDLIISGINHGSNAAICVAYSGTVGAAMEGCVFGVPSFALSLEDHAPDADFTETLRYGRVVAEKMLQEKLPYGTYLNVNVPKIPDVKGMKVCVQTPGRWHSEFMKSKDALGKDIYWLTGKFVSEEPENECTDRWALDNGYASVVPIKIDLTKYSIIEQLKHWEI